MSGIEKTDNEDIDKTGGLDLKAKKRSKSEASLGKTKMDKTDKLPEVKGLKEKLKRYNLATKDWIKVFTERNIFEDQLESVDDETAAELFDIAEKSPYNKNIVGLRNLLFHSLVEVLKNEGLDPSYWVDIFRQKGITDKYKLKNIDEHTYKYLKKKQRYSWEANALEKLCPTTDRIDKDLEELNNDATGLMGRMGKRFSDHADRRQALEEKTPKLEYKLKNDVIMDRIKKESSGSIIVSRLPIEDRKLIESISAGQILRGQFFHGGLETSAIYRRRLIDIPTTQEIELAACGSPETMETFEIYEEEKCSNFETTLNKFGLTLACAAKVKIPFVKVGAKFGVGRETGSEESSAKRKESVFVKVYQLLSVPTASFSLFDVDVQLSNGALERLKKLKTSTNFKEDCTEFFNVYGSHYFDGEYHFGGRYEWIVSSKTESTGDETKNVEMAKTALEGSVSGGQVWFTGEVSAAGEKSKESIQKTESSSEKYKVTKMLTKIGGPQEVDDVSLWKQGLVSYRNTWHIIDRDTSFKSYVGVWELIKKTDPSLGKKVYDIWREIYEKDDVESMAWSKVPLGLETPKQKEPFSE